MNFFWEREGLIMNSNYQFKTDIIKSNCVILNFSTSEIKLLFINVLKRKWNI